MRSLKAPLLVTTFAIALLALHRPATAQVEPDPPRARPNRLAISLGFGLGSAAMSSFHGFTGDAISAFGRASNLKADGPLSSNLQINGELGVRYYFPFHILAHVGYGTIYNWSSVGLSVGPARTALEYHNLAMEVPILIGGYYIFFDRLYVYAAVGPTPFFFARSYWDGEQFNAPDYKADSGAGFTGMGGADFMVGETFGVGLELRYRYLKATNLAELKTGRPACCATIPAIGQQGDTYDLDFSGISVGIYLRLFAI